MKLYAEHPDPQGQCFIEKVFLSPFDVQDYSSRLNVFDQPRMNASCLTLTFVVARPRSMAEDEFEGIIDEEGHFAILLADGANHRRVAEAVRPRDCFDGGNELWICFHRRELLAVRQARSDHGGQIPRPDPISSTTSSDLTRCLMAFLSGVS